MAAKEEVTKKKVKSGGRTLSISEATGPPTMDNPPPDVLTPSIVDGSANNSDLSDSRLGITNVFITKAKLVPSNSGSGNEEDPLQVETR